MNQNMKSIGILTSGGDAPGMNACIRSVTRYALNSGLRVFGIERGYQGLIDDTVNELNVRSVSDIIQRGGTFLKTARCPDFMNLSGQEKAVKTLKKYGIDALVVIGGNGSFMGIKDLKANFNINAVGIPGTIDNDLAYTDYTLGFDTAVNTVLNAINNLRDTMTSHDRVSVVEVMGRKCGDIALYSGMCGGAEIILIPEVEFDINDICDKLKQNVAKGKTSDIIVLAEGVCHAQELKEKIISTAPGISIRCTTLGHIQRGGAPTMQDRMLAAKFGIGAVQTLLNGKSTRVIGIKNNRIIDMDIDEAMAMPSKFDKELYNNAKILSI